LIELLIAIAIIAILATAFLGASRAAMEHARASRTPCHHQQNPHAVDGAMGLV
jgi:prepilin-type N-terminal cleavage/methylation domain-containing protein